MNKEDRRKQLAQLPFAEKLKLLDKLRHRSLAIAAARKQLSQRKTSR